MFSREESARIRQEFWTSFGKSFPRKWTLYRTKIKGFGFKFYFDTKKAMVLIEVDGDLEHRIKYFEKLQSLQNILQEVYLPEALYWESYQLENGKEISCVLVQKEGVSIHNRDTWQETMAFFNTNMTQIEAFWEEYEDFFKLT